MMAIFHCLRTGLTWAEHIQLIELSRTTSSSSALINLEFVEPASKTDPIKAVAEVLLLKVTLMVTYASSQPN